MSVRCDVNRVDVEVVEPGARLRLDLRLCDSDMVEAVPFPEEATARQRQLLDDPADDAAARASADRSQVPRPHLVARHERGVPRRYHELVQVTVEPARGGEARDLAVGGVDDNPLPNAEPLDRLSLPPCQDLLAVHLLNLEVGHGLVHYRMEPDEIPCVVEDHRAALARPR